MLNICKNLFETWNANGIKYCHWKSNEHLMEGLDGETDLDVFVHISHRNLAVELLSQYAFLKCKIQISNQYPNVEEWIGFDYSTGKLVHVHLHFQIITGKKFCKEYVFPIDELIIDTRVQNVETGVYVTDPNLELIILMSRIVLKSNNKKLITIDNDYSKELDYLKERIDCTVLKRYCEKLIPNNGDVFYNLITCDKLSQNNYYDLYIIVKNWLKPYRKYNSIHTFVRYKFFKYRAALISLLNNKTSLHIIDKKTFRGAYLSICFIGQDGSGKSTIAHDVCKWFNWKISAERFYLGSGDHYDGFLKRVLEKSMHKTTNKTERGSDSINNDNSDRKAFNEKKSLLRRMGSFGWDFLRAKYLCKIAHRSYTVIRHSESYIRHDGIALYDRFPQIQFLGLYDGPKIKTEFIDKGQDNYFFRYFSKREEFWLNKVQKHQPTIVFKLLLSPEESIRRKPFEDYDLVRKKSLITKQLVFDKSYVYDIDATQDYDKELIQIKQIVWKHLAERCK